MTPPKTIPVRVSIIREMRHYSQQITAIVQSCGYLPAGEKKAIHGTNLKIKKALDALLQLDLFSSDQLQSGG